MATFEITSPDGKKYRVTAPDGASEADILAYVQAQTAPAPTGTKQPGLREAGARLPTAGRAFINAAQGPLFGFADEIGAGGAAVIDKVTGRNPGMSYGDLYSRYRDIAQGASESYGKENPILSTALQVGASLPLMGAYKAAESALPAATGALGMARNAAIVGAGSGAISGAGNSETVADMPAGAALGAASGGVLSGVLSGAGSGVRAVGRNVSARASAKSAADLARERVATALTRDNLSTQQVADTLRRYGPDARMVTGAGQSATKTLDLMATAPGRTAEMAEQAIREQQRGSAGRLAEAGRDFLGVGSKRFGETVEQLAEQRATASKPLYDVVRQIPVAADSNLQRILQRPVIQEALAQARVAAANADEVLPDIKAGEPVPMAVWDRVKRGLDDVIGLKKRGVDAGTANNAAKSTLSDAVATKQELLKYLDEAVPKNDKGVSLYKAARDAYAGPSALIDAAEEGRRAMRMDGVSIQQATKGMSQSEMSAFRVGAFESLREQVGTEGGRTQLLKMWKEPKTQEKLRSIAPSIRTYQEFADAVTDEGMRKLRLESVGRGSKTAGMGFGMDDEGAAFLSAAAETGGALSAASPTGMLNAVRGMYGRTVMPETVRDQVGQMLLTRGPEAQSLLGDLSRYMTAEEARRAAAAARAGLLGGVSITGLLQNQ
jgi:hypothetical protein